MENKDNVDNNNNEFSDNNDRNVKQLKVNQDFNLSTEITKDLIYFAISNHLVLNRAENQLMDDTISSGDDHILDQHEYPNDYVDDDEDFGNLNIEQNHVTHDYVSPGGLSYWIPVVLDHIKAKIKSTGESYGAALSMYKNYASEVGFDVRLGTIRTTKYGIITQRHFLCNREGKLRTTKTRNIISFNEEKTHLGVNAKQKLFLFYYMVLINILLMILSYNIIMSCLVRTTCFCLVQKGNLIILRRCLFITCQRKIWVQQEHIDCISDSRVGLTFEVNSMRNLNSYIGSKDAKFLVVKMLERKKKKLNALFWADETVKYNYNAFGDVVSLDATFNMNIEYGTSYSWLLRAFLKALKKQLTLVLTDQDPTLNKVVNEVFPMSPHRFIFLIYFFLSQYKSDRIIDILDNIPTATKSVFRKHFHSIIWNSKLERHDFDNAWQSCLDDFNISNNKWMKDMYGLRRRWVPLFFKDIPMSGLMRSTSLSEGQNWSFQNNTFTNSYLLMFMMKFKGVMEC
uniref:FAR1 domain-containing protein n=1 Tax=Lactuca sativa TaxID=4236 RepID=A0A9R1V215_LACSA|nr:hypothetical protein LSAT_V11C700361960 [Lactuca sativa]